MVQFKRYEESIKVHGDMIVETTLKVDNPDPEFVLIHQIATLKGKLAILEAQLAKIQNG